MGSLPPPPPYTLHDPNPSLPGSTSSTLISNTVPVEIEDSIEIDEPLYISGAAYFLMRPSNRPIPNSVLCYRLTLPRGANSDSIKFPQPERKMLERDVDRQDWSTFMNHLLPVYDVTEGSSLLNHSVPGIQRTSRAHNGGLTNNAQPPNSSTLSNLDAVVTEWNHGFFAPRGLKIMLETQHDREPSEEGSHCSSHPRCESRWETVPFNGQENRPANRADRKAKTERGLVLYEAVIKGDKALARQLLDIGADPNAKPMCAVPALTQAVSGGDIEMLQILLDAGANLEAAAPAGPTALYKAVSKEDTALVRLLLERGAKPNAKPPGGEPALCRAASREQYDIVQLLLNFGGDVNATPPAGATAFFKAAEKDDLDLMRLLLQYKADVDKRAPGGATALHRAAARGSIEVVRLLLEHGANIEAKPPGGKPALYHAVTRSDHNLVQLLLHHGASVDAKSLEVNRH